jgi:hypothetical protein
MNRISSYNELVAERKMLEASIVEQQKIISTGFENLKAKLQPLLNLQPILTLFDKKTPGSSLVSAVASAAIDLLVAQGISPKLNWLAKLALSFVSKRLLPRSVNNNGFEETDHNK